MRGGKIFAIQIWFGSSDLENCDWNESNLTENFFSLLIQQKKAATRPPARVMDKSVIRGKRKRSKPTSATIWQCRSDSKGDLDFSLNSISPNCFLNDQFFVFYVCIESGLRNAILSFLTVSHSNFSNLKHKFENLKGNFKFRGGNKRWLAVENFFIYLFFFSFFFLTFWGFFI